MGENVSLKQTFSWHKLAQFPTNQKHYLIYCGLKVGQLLALAGKIT